MKNKKLFEKNGVKIRNVPKSGRKSDPPSGLAADALSRSAFGLAFPNSLFFAFVSLWRVLERGGVAAALVYSSTRHSAILKI